MILTGYKKQLTYVFFAGLFMCATDSLAKPLQTNTSFHDETLKNMTDSIPKQESELEIIEKDATSLSDNETVTALEVITDDENTLAINAAKEAEASELAILKAQIDLQNEQIQLQRQQIAQMQEAMKPKNIALKIMASNNANGLKSGKGVATVMYYAYLDNKRDIANISNFSKKVIVFPSKNISVNVPYQKDKRYFAVKFQLRNVLKRAQLILPVSAIDISKKLVVNLGQCDTNIVSGIKNINAKNVKKYTLPLHTKCFK